MKKILLVSDDHGNKVPLQYVCDKYHDECDYKVHCGDSLESSVYLKAMFDVAVLGNNDLNDLKDFEILEVEGIRIFICHGHILPKIFKPLNYNLALLAKNYNCSVVFHGHTHVASDNTFNNVRIICPGSIDMPRGRKEKTYCIVEVDKNAGIKANFLTYDH